MKPIRRYKGKVILGIIPARGGSKGVPRKNIRLLAGRPLIRYSIDLAKKCSFLYRTVVSTDSKEIASVAKHCGGDVPFLRPKALARDNTPMVQVLKHAVDLVEKEDRIKIDYVVLLQPTNPLRLLEDVKGCVDKIIRTNADSVITVVRVESMHPILMKRIENDLIKPYCLKEIEGSCRQNYKPYAYMRSGGVYVAKRDVLMKSNSVRGKISRPYITPSGRDLGIDSEIDLLVVEQLLRRRRKTGEYAL